MSNSYAAMSPLSRLQEKEELQYLNDRFLSYVSHVRQLGLQANADSSAFLKSTKILEEEIVSLKNIYETELEKLRKEIEEGAHNRQALNIQNSKLEQCIGELQDRLSSERDQKQSLINEVTLLQTKIVQLHAEIEKAKNIPERPENNVEQKNLEHLNRELDQWKHRYEHEKNSRQEIEENCYQLQKRMDFSKQVNAQQVMELQERLDTATSTIVNLEARVCELNKSDMSIAKMLSQMRETSELELKKYQQESDEMYSRNLSILKAQIDNDTERIQNLTQEKTELLGNIGELHSKIRNLEGQVFNLLHQKETLENDLNTEQSRSADIITQLEKKLRDTQEVLVIQMREMTSARDANVPIKAEIEALKILLEEEEKRLQVQMGMAPQCVVSTNIPSSSISASGLDSNISTELQSNCSQQSLVDARKAGLLQSTEVVCKPYNNFSPVRSSSPENSGNFNSGSTCKSALVNMGPNYHYESSPCISRVHVEGDHREKSRVIGPIHSRAKSAPIPVETDKTAQDVHQTMEDTRTNETVYTTYKTADGDAFNELFKTLKKETLFPKQRPKSSPLERSVQPSFQNYNMTTSSSVGDLKIFEVSQDGKFVRLLNEGPNEIEFGNFMIQQNVGGHPIAVFRFPPQIKFPSDSTITVWASINDSKVHNPPHDFFWKDLYKWCTGAECTTILCHPNGQALAWSTSGHRIVKDAYIEPASNKKSMEFDENSNTNKDENSDESLKVTDKNIVTLKSEPTFLRREKQMPPSLSAAKHPHGHTPNASIHPHTSLPPAVKNGCQTFCSTQQPRAMSCHSDPLHDRPGWATPQRMGSAPLRSFARASPQPNKLAGTIRLTSSQPYLSPLQEQLFDETRDHSSINRLTS